jgi:hypothetical protein
MTALNNQTQAIEQQEAALMEQLAQLQAKKQAVIDLESEYTATIEHVKRTMDLMNAAGLDSRNLLKDLAALVTPATVTYRSARATSTSGVNTKLNRPGADTQGGRAWTLFDNIMAELGEVQTGEVKSRAAVLMPNDSIQNVLWHLSNWRKAQQIATASPVPPVVESEPIEPTPAPIFEISPPPKVTDAEIAAVDKRIRIEAEAKKSSAKKVK